jgi:X-Pro dipeptidyl-peptidase
MKHKKFLLPANAILILVFVLGFTALSGALLLSAAPVSYEYGQADEPDLDLQTTIAVDPAEEAGLLEDAVPNPKAADINDVYLITGDVLEIEYDVPVTATEAKALFTIKVDDVEVEWYFLSYFDFGSYAARGGIVNVRLAESLDTGEPRGRRRETAAESYLARTDHIMGPAAAERITVAVGTETKKAEWKAFYTERSLGHMSRVYAYASAEAGNNGNQLLLDDPNNYTSNNIFTDPAKPLYTDEFIARQVAEGMHRFVGRAEFLTLPFVDSGFKALIVGASQSVYEAPEFRELYVHGVTTDQYTRTSINPTDVPGNFIGNGKYKKPFVVGTADDVMRHYSPLKADGTPATGNADSARPRSDYFYFAEAFFDIFYEIGVKVGCPRFPLGPDNDLNDYRFDLQLVKFYNNAKEAGKWPNTAMMNSVKEYYLYGAMVHWEFISESQEFTDKAFPVNTRAELYDYDYDLYWALSGIYGKYEFWTGVGTLQGASTIDDTTKDRTPWFWHNQPDNFRPPEDDEDPNEGVKYEPLKIVSATIVAHNQIDVVFNREVKTVASVTNGANWMIYINGAEVAGKVLENNGYNWKSIRLQTQCIVNFATGEATTVTTGTDNQISYPENRLDNGKPYGRYFAGFSQSDLDERSLDNGGWIDNKQVLGENALEFGEFISVDEAISRGADKVDKKVEIEYIGTADVEDWDTNVLAKNEKFEVTEFRPWIGHAYRTPLTGLYIYLDAAVGDNPDYDAETVAMAGAQMYEAHLQNNKTVTYENSAGMNGFDLAFGEGSGDFENRSGANQWGSVRWDNGLIGVNGAGSGSVVYSAPRISNGPVTYDRPGQRIADGAVRGNGGMILAAGSVLGHHPGQQPQSNGLRGVSVGDSYRVEGWGGTTFQSEDVLVMRDYNLCRYRNESLVMHEGGHGIDSFTGNFANTSANYGQMIYDDISAAWATAVSPANGGRWMDVNNIAAYVGTRTEYTSTIPTFYAGVMREQMMGVNDGTWTPMSTRSELFRYDPYGFEVFKRIFYTGELHLWYENKVGDPAYRVMPEDWELLRDIYPEFSHWTSVDDLISWGYSIPQAARYNPYTEKLNGFPAKTQVNDAVRWVSWNVPDVWGPEPYAEPSAAFPNNKFDFVGGSSYFPIPDFDDPNGLEPLKNQEHPFARPGGVKKPERPAELEAYIKPIPATIINDSAIILSRPVLVQFEIEDYNDEITSNNVSSSFKLMVNGEYRHFYFWSFEEDDKSGVATVTLRLDWPLEKNDEVEVSVVIGDESFQENLRQFPDLYDAEKGTTAPAWKYDPANVNNIVEEVYVEVPCDTDGDGKRDLIRLWIRRPSESALDGIRVPVIYEQSPYREQTNPLINHNVSDLVVNDDTTHYTYADMLSGKKRSSDWYWGNEAKLSALDKIWYGPNGIPAARVPLGISINGAGAPFNGGTWTTSGRYTWYDYFVPRGYAVILGSSIGNKFSEGFTNCGDVEEILCAMATIKWLNGEAKAYTNQTDLIEVDATTWCNGNVALLGQSYNGTIPIGTACSGVEGLKAILPVAGISSWYDYYRENGGVIAANNFQGEDADILAIDCDSRRINIRTTGNYDGAHPPYAPETAVPSWSTYYTAPGEPFSPLRQKYEVFLNQMRENQDRLSGDYNPFWDDRNYLSTVDQVNCGILLSHGFNDFNVKPKQMDQFYQGVKEKTDAPIKLMLHRGGHAQIWDHKDAKFFEYAHKWFDHFLYGIDNGIVDEIPEVTIADNLTGKYEFYDQWPVPGSVYTKYYLNPEGIGSAGSFSLTAPDVSTATVKDSYDIVTAGIDTPINTDTSGGRGGLTNARIGAWESYIINYDSIAVPNSDRLVFMSDITETFDAAKGEGVRFSGTIKLALEIASDKPFGYISAYLVDLGPDTRTFNTSTSATQSPPKPPTVETIPAAAGVPEIILQANYPLVDTITDYKVICTGHADIQNPNPAKKIYKDSKDTNYIPAFYYQTKEIEPGEYNQYYFEFEPNDYAFKEGNKMGLVVFSTDYRNTLIPLGDDRPELTIKFGANTYVEIPSVGTFSTDLPTLTHTIKYDANEGTGAITQETVDFEDSYTIKANTFSRENHTFTAWNTAADGSGTAYAAGVTIASVTGNITLFAQWKAITYIVTFHPDGGTPAPAVQTVNAGEKATAPPAMTKSGYTFAGWYTNSALTGSIYNFETSVTANLDLYAKWETTGGSGTGGGSTGGDIIIGPLKPSLRNILGNDTQGPTFTDVPATHWAYQYVEYLARRDYVKGKSATLYAPTDPITRAEFVTILARMEGAAQTDYSGPFTDVVSGSYYAGAVDWAVKAGVTIGTSATTFSPNRTISRQEIAAMLARYVTYKLVTLVAYNQPISFTDEAQIAAYAKDYVKNMQTADVINGYPDGSFKPLANATRAEAAKMLALVHYLMNYK